MSAKNDKDSLGERIKMYEKRETGRRFLPGLPVYARIDGKNFSRFTRGMQRPYDTDMVTCMVETTKHLVESTNALIGYTQSDEISLVWAVDNPDSQIFFDGKIFKMTSVLAAMATAKFTQLATPVWTDKVESLLPVFDARVFELPNKTEAANAFLWRVNDATKNSISMAARSQYSHKDLLGKSSSEMQEMLFQKGINWNDYPAFFKRGTFVRREHTWKELPPEVMDKIPPEKRPTDGQVLRSHVVEIDMPPFQKVTNRVGVIFDRETPILDDG